MRMRGLVVLMYWSLASQRQICIRRCVYVGICAEVLYDHP
jgi:hypothetical protein